MRFQCPACGHGIRSNRAIPEGTQVQCPTCRAILAVPAESSTPPQTSTPPPRARKLPVVVTQQDTPILAEVVPTKPKQKIMRSAEQVPPRPGVPVGIWLLAGFVFLGIVVMMLVVHNQYRNTVPIMPKRMAPGSSWSF